MAQVAQVCDHALWLERGEVRASGPAPEIVAAYQSAMLVASRRLTPSDAPGATTFQGRPLVWGENRIGSGEVTLENLRLLRRDGALAGTIEPGQALIVQARVALHRAVPPARFSLTIADPAGTVCFDTNSQVDGVDLAAFRGGEVIELEFDRLDLSPGSYAISVGLWQADWSHAHDYHAQAYTLEVAGGIATKGVIAPPRRWRVHPPA